MADITQASVGGLTGSIAAPLYCATKHAMVGFVKSMKDTEPLTGVKVTTLCPGGVMTPLFDAQKMKQYSVTPEICAAHLLDLLQKKEYPCGSVLEVTLHGHRLIPEWNVSPPEGQGTGQEMMTDEFVGNLLGPIKAKMESERTESKL
jgi:short-subunit dehydrogenase